MPHDYKVTNSISLSRLMILKLRNSLPPELQRYKILKKVLNKTLNCLKDKKKREIQRPRIVFGFKSFVSPILRVSSVICKH